jgi:hypothetical protein
MGIFSGKGRALVSTSLRNAMQQPMYEFLKMFLMRPFPDLLDLKNESVFEFRA